MQCEKQVMFVFYFTAIDNFQSVSEHCSIVLSEVDVFHCFPFINVVYHPAPLLCSNFSMFFVRILFNSVVNIYKVKDIISM